MTFEIQKLLLNPFNYFYKITFEIEFFKKIEKLVIK